MLKFRIKPGFLPTVSQQLLLNSALRQDHTAVKSWQDWKSMIEFDDLDQGSYRLLPLAYKNLTSLGIEDPLFINMKEIYQNFWEINERINFESNKVFEILNLNGIETIYLKGWPLIENYYKDPGIRPMGDVDILVRDEKFLNACNIIIDAGWVAELPMDQLSSYHKYIHAIDFLNPNDTHIDLHWTLFPGAHKNNTNELIWENASTQDFNGKKMCILDPTDELFYICIHGARWSRVPPIRWIPDALFIIKDEGERINWSRFFQLAQQNHMLLQSRDTLTYLKKEYGIPIPNSILRELMKTHINFGYKIEYLFTTQPIPVFWDIVNKVFHYLRMSEMKNGASGFLNFLKFTWGVDSFGQLFLTIIRALLTRIKLDIFTPPYFVRKEISATKKISPK